MTAHTYNRYIKNGFLWTMIFCCALPGVVLASTTDGTISGTYKYATFLNTAFGSVNFGATNGNVHVTDTAVTGYAWGSHVGWVNLDPTNGGIANTEEGALSGYAWGEQIGWINFSPANGGVTINGSGQFVGYAWSDVAGWLKFDCGQAASCVTTDWRPESVRSATPAATTTSSGSHSGSSANPPTPPTPPPAPVVTPPPPPAPAPVDTPPAPPAPSDGPSAPSAPSGDGGTGGAGAGGGGGALGSVARSVSSAIQRFTNVIDIENAPVALQKANEVAKAFVTDPVGAKVTQTVTTLGVVTSGAGVAGSIFLNPVAASEVVLLPIRIWGLLLSVLGLRKRYKPWGVVYDSITKQPLDPAYVSLLDEKGNEVATAITDINGRYGFLVTTPGTYTLVANKTNYTFPSARLSGRLSDELYPNLYFSEKITITPDNLVIDKNIPLDPVNFDWNEFQKAKQGKFMNFYSKYDRMIARFNTYFFGAGLFVSLLALVYAPAPYNLVVFGFYIVVLLLRIFGLTPKTHGAIIERATGKSMSFALIHIFSTTFNNEISTKVADAYGRYYCLLPKGSYIMKIDRKNEDGTYTQVYESKPMEVKSGIINENLKI